MSSIATYGYDGTAGGNNGKGRRTSSGLSTGDYASTQAYDLRGRVITDAVTIAGQPYTTTYTYNAADQSTAMTYPDNETVSFGYNARLLLNLVGGYASAIAYNALGKPLTLLNGGLVTTTYTYDPSHFRLTAMGFAGTGAPDLSFSYGYEDIGNVKTITETGMTTSFTYDHLDRLTGSSAGYSTSYSYDVLGDLTAKTEAGATRNLTYTLSTRPKHAPRQWTA